MRYKKYANFIQFEQESDTKPEVYDIFRTNLNFTCSSAIFQFVLRIGVRKYRQRGLVF